MSRRDRRRMFIADAFVPMIEEHPRKGVEPRNGDVGLPYRPAAGKPLAVRLVEACCGITVAVLAARLWLYAITGGAL